MSGDRGVRTPLDGFAEVTLQTADPTTLARFYCSAFGCEVLAEEDDRIWLAVGRKSRLGLWTPGEKEFGDQGGTRVHFAFRVAPGTLDDLAARLQAEGIEMRGPVDHEGGDRSIYVEDPEGNVVEAWDFFHREEGRREGVRGLAD
jgi:catechol-2,3-dioxygenase